jgi:hypothetical protein
MAAVKAATIESFSFDGEAVGVAGANALRGVKSLADRAPAGRLFAAIATLSDTAGDAALAFESAGLAVLRMETEEADNSLHRGMKLADKLKRAFGTDAGMATPLPAFIRRQA